MVSCHMAGPEAATWPKVLAVAIAGACIPADNVAAASVRFPS